MRYKGKYRFLVVYPGQRPRQLKIYQNRPLRFPDLPAIMSNNGNNNIVMYTTVSKKKVIHLNTYYL